MLIYGDKTGAETINDYLMGRSQNSWKSFALFPPCHTNTNRSIGTYKFKINTKPKNNDNKIKSKPAHMLHCHIKQIKYKYKYKVIQLQDGKKRRWQNGVDFWQTVPFLWCSKQTPLVWKFVLMSAPNRLLLSSQQTPSSYFFQGIPRSTRILGGTKNY